MNLKTEKHEQMIHWGLHLIKNIFKQQTLVTCQLHQLIPFQKKNICPLPGRFGIFERGLRRRYNFGVTVPKWTTCAIVQSSQDPLRHTEHEDHAQGRYNI